MSGIDIKRRNRHKANQRGLTIVGLNGEIRPASIVGGNHYNRTATVYVDDTFAPIRFPISWGLVKAIADGHVAQISIKPVPHLERLLNTKSDQPSKGMT